MGIVTARQLIIPQTWDLVECFTVWLIEYLLPCTKTRTHVDWLGGTTNVEILPTMRLCSTHCSSSPYADRQISNFLLSASWSTWELFGHWRLCTTDVPEVSVSSWLRWHLSLGHHLLCQLPCGVTLLAYWFHDDQLGNFMWQWLSTLTSLVLQALTSLVTAPPALINRFHSSVEMLGTAFWVMPASIIPILQTCAPIWNCLMDWFL